MLNFVTCMFCDRAAMKCPSSWMVTIAANTDIACNDEAGPLRSMPAAEHDKFRNKHC